jgi:5-methylcytosine-specific restriction endonuclease McrA
MGKDRAQETCFLCGKYGELERHHIKTRGSGGGDEDWNIAMVHRICHIKIHSLSWGKILERDPSLAQKLQDKGWVFMNGKLRRND